MKANSPCDRIDVASRVWGELFMSKEDTMSWKCVCKEQNNPDDSKICKKCGRARPKYLGIKLDLAPSESMTKEQKSVWYLMIAYDYLLESDKYLKLHKELSEELKNSNYDRSELSLKTGEFSGKIKENCRRCLAILDSSEAILPGAQFEDVEGCIQTISSIRSNCYFNLGSIYFRQKDFEKAIEYYKASYDSDPNQVSIYNIAIATINLPVEGGGLFGGKKKKAAQETKREQEVELLKKTVKFAPFSDLGIKTARLLIEYYGIIDIDT